MMEENMNDLYPTLTDDERRVAGETLDRYLELAWELYEETKLRDT